MNDPVPISRGGAMQTAADIRAQVNLVQEVMRSIMQADTHYGVIPGTQKPSLYKAGSEVLLATFRIAVTPQVEDLSTPDEVRYRVKCIGTHQTSGIIVGTGIGECSSSEEKYRWRKAVCEEEFEATPETRRRLAYKRGRNNTYTVQQVRAEPADVANTVLKMAKKRAQIDLTLTATAASDIFTQDIEDLPEAYRHDEDAAPPAPKEYPQADFDKNFPQWQDLIESGRKTPAQLIAKVESKAPLTDEMKKKIRAVKPKGADE